jgi:SPP1 gp7 family putative phage head morphogenesis protein
MALVLRHFVAQHPHAARLRKRHTRRLDAIRPSLADKVWYYSTLRQQLLIRMRTAGREALEALRPHWPRVTDAPPHTIRFEVARARAKLRGVGSFAAHVSTKFAGKVLNTVDDKLAAAVKRNVGVEIRQALTESGPISTEVDRVRRENVELITSIPEQYFDDLEDRLGKGWEAGASWETMVSDVMEIGDVAERRAAFIARDQTNKANAGFNRVRQQNLGINRAEWQTAGDGNVRETHAEMEGEIFDWDEAPLVGDEHLFPGEDYNCRCVGAPVLDLDEFQDEGPDVSEVDEDDVDFGDELAN